MAVIPGNLPAFLQKFGLISRAIYSPYMME